MPPPRRGRGPGRGRGRGRGFGPRHHHGPAHHRPGFRFRFGGPGPRAPPRPWRRHPPGPAVRCCNCLIYTLQLLFCCGLCWLCRCGCYADDHPYHPPPHEREPPTADNLGGYQTVPQQDIASAPLLANQEPVQVEGGKDVIVQVTVS